jgi:hypothetical protein
MAINYDRFVSTVMSEFGARLDAATALDTLSLTTALQSGTAVSGWILGATKGSTITSNIPGISVNSALRTYSGTPTGGAQTIADGLVETLGASANSPKSTSISVAAAAATAPSLAALSLSSGTAQVGTAKTINILGATSGSAITGSVPDGMTLNSNARTITGTPNTPGTFNFPLVETLAGATGSPKSTNVSVVVASASTPAVAIGPSTVETFTYPNGTNIRDLPGWGAYRSGTATARIAADIQSNQARLNVAGSDFGSPADYITAFETGSPFHSIEGTTITNIRSRIAVGGVDNANCIWADINPAVPDVTVYKNVAGTVTSIQNTNVGTLGAFPGPYKWKVVIGKDNVLVYVNGILRVAPAINGTTGGARVSGTRAGFMNSTVQNLLFDDVTIKANSNFLTVNNIANFWPSDIANNGQAISDYTGRTIPLTGTCLSDAGTVAPTNLQFRLFDAALPLVVLYDWTDVTDFALQTATTWFANIRVPAGGPYRAEIRMKNDTNTSIYLESPISVGLTYFYYGQSNAHGMMVPGTQGATTLDPYRNSKTFALGSSLVDNIARQWVSNKDNHPSQVGSRMISDAMPLGASPTGAARGNMPVGACGGGVPANPLVNLIKTSTNLRTDPFGSGQQKNCYQLLLDNIAAGNAIGRVAFGVWDQGEAEASGSVAEDWAAYKVRHAQLFADMRADIGGRSTMFMLQVLTGRIGTTVGEEGTGAIPANFEALRAYEQTTPSVLSNVLIANHNIGAPISDVAGHYAGIGNVVKGQRQGRTFINGILAGGGSWSQKGPLPGAPTKTATTVTIPYTLNGATSIAAYNGETVADVASASAITGYQFSVDDFATYVAPTSVVLTGNNVVATFASIPAGTLKYRNYRGRNPDTTSWPTGVYPDGTFIGAFPTPAPVVVA